MTMVAPLSTRVLGRSGGVPPLAAVPSDTGILARTVRRMTNTMQKFMTVPDVCAELGITRSTLEKWRSRGLGPAFRRLPNGQLRLARADFDAWCAALPAVA